MSESESTVRIRTTAEIAAIVQYAQALIQANQALAAHIQLQQRANAGAGGGSSGPAPATGGGPPAPGQPPPTPPPQQPPGGGPPPAPPAHPAATPAPGSPGEPAAPPTGTPPPSPPPPSPPSSSGGGSGGGARGGARQRQPESDNPWRDRAKAAMGSAYQGGRSFLSHTASTAIGVGLGTSLMGLPMHAINQYMTLSTVIKQVDQRFRDAAEGSELFATKMGFGIARSAQLAEALGSTQNTFVESEGVRYAGFARHTGADPENMMRIIGRLTTLQGRSVTDTDLGGLLGTARNANMDQGRLEEFFQRIESHAREQFAATGRMDIRDAMGIYDLPSQVYGRGTAGAANDETLIPGLHSTLTSKGPMASYMMRVMGYGRPGGPSYMDMRERLEAGVYDSRNLIDLFESFQDRGMSQGAQFRAIESVAGGSLKAHQIRALVENMQGGGLDQLKRNAALKDAGIETFVDSLTPKELRLFEDGGFGTVVGTGDGKKRVAGLGIAGVSAGESYSNRIEGTNVTVGGELAQAIPNIQDTIDSLGRTFVKLVGGDIGSKLEKITGLIERAALLLEGNTHSFTEGGWMHNVPGAAGVAENIGRVTARAKAEGVGAAAVELGEINLEKITGQDWSLSDGMDLTRKGGSGR